MCACEWRLTVCSLAPRHPKIAGETREKTPCVPWGRQPCETRADHKCLFSDVIWGQCTELLRAKDGCNQMKVEHDTVELLKSIKDCVFKFSDQKKAAHSLHEALRKFCNGHQEKSSNAQECCQRFKNHAEVAEHCGGSLGNHQGLVTKKLEERGLSIATCSVDEHTEAVTDSREECLACAFLLGSDRKRCGKLIEDLENDHVQRNDKHPKTLVEACNLLIHWKKDPKNLMIGLSTSDGMAFANVAGEQRPPQDNSHVHRSAAIAKRWVTTLRPVTTLGERRPQARKPS